MMINEPIRGDTVKSNTYNYAHQWL